MSKQLSISAAFSTFAMAACALFATTGDKVAFTNDEAGTPNQFEAPAYTSQAADLKWLPRLGD